MADSLTRTAGVAEARAFIEAGQSRFPLRVPAGDRALHRLWAGALYCRMLDGYDSALRLHEAGLDSDARALVRIGFEHLVAFAWLVAVPDDPKRVQRLARPNGGSTPGRPPPTSVLCRELDAELPSQLGALQVRSSLFSYWYEEIYRAGCGFVHPSQLGLSPLIAQSAGGGVVSPWRDAPGGLGQILENHLRAAAEIARELAPWLAGD